MSDSTTDITAPDTDLPKPKRGRPRLDDEIVPAVLDAAERLFAERRALDVSIRQIAAEAGVSHPAIYRYFEGKDDILRQVIQRGANRQFLHAEGVQNEGAPGRGAIDWTISENRAYALSVMRAALEGQTPSSIGIDPATSVVQRSIELLERGDTPFRADVPNARVAVASAYALAVGWVACEDWIVEAAGLQDRDRTELRADIDAMTVRLVSAPCADDPVGSA